MHTRTDSLTPRACLLWGVHKGKRGASPKSFRSTWLPVFMLGFPPPPPDAMSGWRPQSKAVFVVMGVGWGVGWVGEEKPWAPSTTSRLLDGPPSGHPQNHSWGPFFSRHEAKPDLRPWQPNEEGGFLRAPMISGPGRNRSAKQLAV